MAKPEKSDEPVFHDHVLQPGEDGYVDHVLQPGEPGYSDHIPDDQGH